MNDLRFYRIEAGKIEGLSAQLAKLNKRAGKIGAPSINLFATGVIENVPVYADHNDPSGKPIIKWYHQFHTLALCGETPKFAGWSLAAVVEHTDEGNILRKSPECTVELAKYRTGAQKCDHCQALRNRRDTYLVIHEAGAIKQIGSNCIKDFLGHANPHMLAQWAEIIYSASEICGEAEEGDGGWEGGGSGSGHKLLNISQYLTWCAVSIRVSGFVSGKAEFESQGSKQSTKSEALFFMDPPRGFKGTIPAIEDTDRERADRARDFVLANLGSQNVESLSDFEHNLLMVAKCEAVEFRNAGICAFIVEYYRRETEKAVEKAKRDSVYKVDAHFGEVGTRYKGLEIIYVGSSSFESEFYGTQFFHRLVGPGGERLLWKTGNELDIVEGQPFKADFTVKKHDEYNGKKQTKINRLVAK